jgi:hypothetical protein
VTGTWGALAVGLLVIEAALLFVHWISPDSPARRQPRGRHDARGRHGQDTIDEDLMRHVLTAMPTELLLDEWEATRSRLTAGAGDPLVMVHLRDLLIEELRSRDPAGTARWLLEGPADLPDLYIRPDPGLGS